MIIDYKLVTVHELRMFMSMRMRFINFAAVVLMVMMLTMTVQMFVAHLLMSVF